MKTLQLELIHISRTFRRIKYEAQVSLLISTMHFTRYSQIIPLNTLDNTPTGIGALNFISPWTFGRIKTESIVTQLHQCTSLEHGPDTNTFPYPRNTLEITLTEIDLSLSIFLGSTRWTFNSLSRNVVSLANFQSLSVLYFPFGQIFSIHLIDTNTLFYGSKYLWKYPYWNDLLHQSTVLLPMTSLLFNGTSNRY